MDLLVEGNFKLKKCLKIVWSLIKIKKVTVDEIYNRSQEYNLLVDTHIFHVYCISIYAANNSRSHSSDPRREKIHLCALPGHLAKEKVDALGI